MMFLSPSSLHCPPLPSGQSFGFHPAKHLTEAFILFENFDVVNGVAPGEVEQYQGEDYLLIRPSLELPHLHVGTDMIPQPQNRGKVEVDGKAGKGCHSRVGFLFFVLVGQDALWHNGFTSLVMELVS